MPVGYTNRTFDPGNFGIGSIAQMAMGAFARGRGANPQAEPSMRGVYGFDPAATATAPVRDYLGGNVAGAQALLKALVPQPPPPERGPVPQLAGGPPVPMSKPQIGPAMAGYQGGGPVVGTGDGRSDSVPAMVDGQGIAQLSTDEYVVPADVVSALGRGSSAAGAKKLDAAVQQVRSGYATKLKGMKGPKAGGGKKGLGGLFQTKQDSETELPDYLKDVAGSLPGRISSYEKARPSAVSEIAKFTPDQQAFFERTRQAANDPTGAQSAYQRGQDLLGGIYQGGDPWSDKLIEQSMGEYDRGTAIDAAARRRSAAGRGAFGEGTQLAEVEAGAAAERGRGLLGSQLREQGLTRRTQAAQQIGELAGKERAANVSDVGLLGGIGEIEYGRAQQVAEAPWQKVARINSLLQGAPTSTSTTTTDSPLKLMIGMAAAAASGAKAGAMKGGGRVRAGGRASHRKRAQDQLYADGGKIGATIKKSTSRIAGLDRPLRETPRHRSEKSIEDILDEGPRTDYRMPTPFVPGTADAGEQSPYRLRQRQEFADGGRIPIPRSKPKRRTPLPEQLPNAPGLETLSHVLASQQDLLDQRMPEPHVSDSGDENEIIGELARFGRPPPRGAPLHGRRQLKLADGGLILPGAFQRIGYAAGGYVPPPERAVDWRTVTGGGNSASSGLGDWFNRYVMSRSDPMAEAGKQFRGETGLLPPPPERTGEGANSIADQMKQRVAELVGPSVPDAVPAPTAPIPVSRPATVPKAAKPARKGGIKTAAATPVPVPAAGIGALPERLRSLEEPITAAPPSGIKVTEAPPPPKPPPADAPAEAKQSWFDKWSSNPLTQFGLAMMASSPGESVGSAIGRSGLAAIAGAAAGRKESREEQRLAIADQRAQAQEDRDEKADVRAMMKIGLDEEQAKEVAANNREMRRQADERIKLQEQQGQQRIALEQARINATLHHYGVREGQMAEGLNIRRQALAKGKAAADPNKIVREALQKDLAAALHPDTGDPATAEALRQQIAALDTSVPPPEGAALDEEE